jgi:RNA polymerase-interacting CarD/CdnL/TRCF family regulator
MGIAAAREGKGVRMQLGVGNKISYPLQGPCLIGAVVTKIIGGAPIEFHRFIPLGEGGAEFLVPFDHEPAAGVRRLLDVSEIPEVLARLTRPALPSGGTRHRIAEHLRLFATGKALDLADAIASLTEMRRMNRLVNGEHSLLDKARRLLAREIAEVLSESEAAAEDRIDEALEAGGRAPRGRLKMRGGA